MHTGFDPRSAFLSSMQERGAFHQATDLEGLDGLLSQGIVSGYIGFDATAPSLHAGSLLSLMALRRLQQAGHRPIVLLGGGTTKVGDPSFRSTTRPMLDEAAIVANKAGIAAVFDRFLRFDDGPTGALMVDNADWLDAMDLFSFLRGVGRHFTVSSMLAFDSVKTRLDGGDGLSFLEFSYMLLQAHDFVELAQRHGCMLQMGGSDQWGNIVNGVHLGKRAAGLTLHGLTTPLLTNPDGSKMGKTAQGTAVWLDAARTPPFAFWQFWRNTPDRDVGRFLSLFTDLPMDTCRRLGALEGAEIGEAKIALADAVTTLVHGADAAAAARSAAASVFGQGEASEGLPEVRVALEGPDLPLAHLLVAAGFAPSGKAAKRLVEEGGARLDGVAITDPHARVDSARLIGGVRLSAGRKRHAWIVGHHPA